MDILRKFGLIGGPSATEESTALPLVPKPAPTKRHYLHQAIQLLMIVSSALMVWKGLIVATGSESPIVVVLSGSMEPAFYRGDILFLNRPNVPVEVGDIVVYNTGKREDIPIVHRITRVHKHDLEDIENVHILTKGDNNYGDDITLYPRGVNWLQRKHLLGTVRGFLPYIGWATIVMNDYPAVKYCLIGGLALWTIFGDEES